MTHEDMRDTMERVMRDDYYEMRGMIYLDRLYLYGKTNIHEETRGTTEDGC